MTTSFPANDYRQIGPFNGGTEKFNGMFKKFNGKPGSSTEKLASSTEKPESSTGNPANRLVPRSIGEVGYPNLRIS
jgi:hypothetical protein